MNKANYPSAGQNQEILDGNELVEHRATSMIRLLSEQFLEHRFAVVSLGIVTTLMIVAIFAPLIASFLGVDPNRQSIFHRFKPVMTTVERSNSAKEDAVEYFIEKNTSSVPHLISEVKNLNILDQEINDEDVLFELIHQLNDPAIVSQLEMVTHPLAEQYLELGSGFKSTHFLGTDELGRDVLIRLFYGAGISVCIGLLVGSLAGFYGGWMDAALMRITDSLLSLPFIPVAILLAAIDLKQIPVFNFLIRGENESIAKMIVILCIFSWMTAARVVRACVLSTKEKEYVLAAKNLGAHDFFIILVHIIPNIIAPLLVQVGNAIMFESALSFLGLGVQPPAPTWGNMLFNAQELILESPMLAIYPGIFIFITVISFNFIGDGLQDAIDPKSVRR